jgi:hypothetical protein
MIHSGLSRLSNYETLVLPEYRDAGWKSAYDYYASGGSTPEILYVVSRKIIPKAWSMWVSIIPVGGLETSWEDWKTFQNNLKMQQAIKA